MSCDFCGWYFKCQSAAKTVAVIPAVHRTDGRPSASVQLITDDASWSVPVPYVPLPKNGLPFRLGDNCFGQDGLTLHLRAPGLSAAGCLRFGVGVPLRYDVMGPFRHIPGMECRHSIVSMRHRVSGVLRLNGTNYLFNNALGYIEGDRGRSFPRRYLWSHCFFDGGSLTVSAADIPFAGRTFTGVICVIYWKGRMYRLATYLGARTLRIENDGILIRQGPYTFAARLLEHHAQPLRAPTDGLMERTIRESAVCRAAYRFEKNGRTLFSFETDRASFEYEY